MTTITHPQVGSTVNELGELRAEHDRLWEQLSLRDEVLKQLEEKTASLDQQHQEALENVSVYS